jgi:hypothetical protein
MCDTLSLHDALPIYTVSEYNHPAPNDFQAETVPMLAAWAAAQDWDGVWLFDYWESSEEMQPDRIRGFFDMAGNPAKWGFMRAGAAIFRQGGITPLPRVMSLNITTHEDDVLGDLVALQQRYGSNMMAAVNSRTTMSWQNLLTMGMEVSLKGHSGALDRGKAPGPELTWEAKGGHGIFSASGPGAQVMVMHGPTEHWVKLKADAEREGRATAGLPVAWARGLSLVSPDFAAVTVTALDGKPIDQSAAVLVTACGRVENTDMKFSADRRTVGRNWGTAPVRVEPIDGNLTISRRPWKLFSVAPDGTPRDPIGLGGGAGFQSDGNGGAYFTGSFSVLPLSPLHRTMWYLLTPVEKP